MGLRRALAALLVVAGCASPEPDGLAPTAPGTGAEVKFDFYHRPLPDIPLPNDIATRFDPSSPTKRRLNASMKAATRWESSVRELIDGLDGWGTYAPISVGFTKPLDVDVLYRRHQGDDYDFSDDAVLVLDITPDSPDFCRAAPLDLGEGNFPLVLERREYYPNDPRQHTEQLLYEEVDEDTNGNARLDPGEDTDMDGVLDKPNTRYPNAGPFEAMGFYERETNSLILRPILPLRENTTYAVVLTRRLLDEDGRPVRSPFRWINHASQTEALRPLERCLGGYGLALADVAFTWPFTTQSVTRHYRAVRDGLYGVGPLSRLSEEFPPTLLGLYDLKPRGSGVNLKIVKGDDLLRAVTEVLRDVIGGGSLGPQEQAMLDSMRFVDFHVVGAFESPQFFPRVDDEGNPLPLYKQVWRLDPVTGEAFVRRETISFWLTVPKHRNGPAPVALLGHGHTSNKLEMIAYFGNLARHGIATLGMEAVGHGIGLSDLDQETARSIFRGKGLEPMFHALIQDRALDQNNDGKKDSGVDFWTAYTPHTRDVLRQSVVDYMRMMQILKSFDGSRRWSFDVDGDGEKELAGDFDADGKVDVGGLASLHVTGGSLGGIMSAAIAGIEPHVVTAVPVAVGGGLSDIGVRRAVGDVSILLRMMGPLLLTLPDGSGKLEWWQYVPDLRSLGKVKLGPVEAALQEGDTAIARNLTTGEFRCARVQAGGLLRAAVSSDEGDALALELYRGPLPSAKPEGCRVPEAVTPYLRLDQFAVEATFQGKTYPAGSPLLAVGDGFGFRRGTPELRRFMGIAQLILDPSDPINYAPHWEQRLLRFGTGEEVRSRVLVVNTVGDTSVPVATGAAVARAGGFIELFAGDPRYGKTPNRVLIDTGAIEGVERTGRHFNSLGEPVLLDVEHLSSEIPVDDGFDVPRLSPPLRLVRPSTRVGGITGVLFPMPRPTGDHGYDGPNPSRPFDIGTYMGNILGRYLASDGKDLSFDRCQHDSSCSWIQPLPPQ